MQPYSTMVASLSGARFSGVRIVWPHLIRPVSLWVSDITQVDVSPAMNARVGSPFVIVHVAVLTAIWFAPDLNQSHVSERDTCDRRRLFRWRGLSVVQMGGQSEIAVCATRYPVQSGWEHRPEPARIHLFRRTPASMRGDSVAGSHRGYDQFVHSGHFQDGFEQKTGWCANLRRVYAETCQSRNYDQRAIPFS